MTITKKINTYNLIKEVFGNEPFTKKDYAKALAKLSEDVRTTCYVDVENCTAYHRPYLKWGCTLLDHQEQFDLPDHVVENMKNKDYGYTCNGKHITANEKRTLEKLGLAQSIEKAKPQGTRNYYKLNPDFLKGLSKDDMRIATGFDSESQAIQHYTEEIAKLENKLNAILDLQDIIKNFK